jgi:hypothetical protein
MIDINNYMSWKPITSDEFGKGNGTKCSVLSIEYTGDANNTEAIDCFIQTGPKKEQSKSLLTVVLELRFTVWPNCKLDELKSMLSGHKAFQSLYI